MRCLLSDQDTAAAETFLCGTCYYGPDGYENQSYARECAAQSEDINPIADFVDCTGNDAAGCCICGVYEWIDKDED